MWYQRIFRSASRAVESRGGSAGAPTAGEATALSPAALRQLNRLHLRASRYLSGTAVGVRPSLRRRPAYDFREHRAYVPGDDIRFVDWKASSRQEHVFVRQGEHPKEATVNLLVDCSASMGWGDPRPKHLAALELATALGYAALNQNDRLLIQPLSTPQARSHGPLLGKGQTAAMARYLRTLGFGGRTDLVEAVRDFARGTRGGLTFVISDLLGGADLAAMLDLLRFPTWDVVVVHLLHPAELRPTLRGDFQMVDIETGQIANYDVDEQAVATYQERMTAWLTELETVCIDHLAFYLLIPSGWSLAGEMIPYLRSVGLLDPI